ncbi:hypothetical protein ABK040_001709 [Willaertia magna]
MNDYSFNETDNCQLSTKLKSLSFRNFVDKINFTMNFKKDLPFNFDSLQNIYFNSLNINNANVTAKNIHFNNCVVNNFDSSVFDSNIFIVSNSAITNLTLTKFKFVTFYNSEINGANITTFDTFLTDNCNFISMTTINHGAKVTMQNDEFSHMAEIIIIYVTIVSLDNSTFPKTNVTTADLFVRFCESFSIKNSKVYSIDRWALLLSVNTIVVDNLFSTGSVEMLLPINVQISNSHFTQNSKLGVRISDANSITITNTNFTQCSKPLQIEDSVATVSIYFQVQISNCLFTENYAVDGGAIYITSNTGEVRLNNCNFISNRANNNGGALYLRNSEENSKMTIENCKFVTNSAGSFSVIDKDEGNGGAIHAQGNLLELSNDTVFFENKAVRGGAIFTNCVISKTNALFKSNYAKVAGGGIFLFQTNNVNDYAFNFQNNTALIYGSDRASFIRKIVVQYSIDDHGVMSELTVFPGLIFDIIFKAYDMFQNPVVQILEMADYKENFDQNNINLFSVSSHSAGFYKFYAVKSVNYTLPSGGENINFTVHFPEASALVEFKIVNCPSSYADKIAENRVYCEPKGFPLSAIISVSVVVAILFFAVGLGVGILILYALLRIMKKLKRLAQKEKAELEMELKIIDKRVIFGDNIDYTPLLEDDGNSNSNKGGKKKKLSERKESFLIPIEELEVEKKIGEGGCGTVYSAKWGDNTVAIKSINAIDQEEDFEREVSLLSSLRHPNIVTFYGVTVTDSYKVINKDNNYVLKYSNANKLFLYFNKKVDEQLMNYILERVDNKKVVGINYRDNSCVITFYNKKDRDEMMERKVFENISMIDKGYFSMNECYAAIIQSIYNVWDRIVEEGNSLVINEKDITIKTAYTKVKKELRYNYIIQLENYEIANILYGQFIVVNRGNYKLENPSEIFFNDKNKSISNQQKENNLKNNMEDCLNDYIDLKVNYDNQHYNSNNNIDKQDINSILSKLIESNIFLYSTVQNMSSNIEMLHKEIKMIGNRVDALESESKRSRNIIKEDSPMCKSSKSNLYHQSQAQLV